MTVKQIYTQIMSLDIMGFFNECSEGVGERGLDGTCIEGMLVKMDRSGVGFRHGIRQSMCVLSILKFACAFVQANQSFLFTF